MVLDLPDVPESQHFSMSYTLSLKVSDAIARLQEMQTQQSSEGIRQSSQGLPQSAVSLPQSPVGLQQSAVGFQQSAVGFQQSPVGLQQSAMGFQQSAVGLQQSAVHGPRSSPVQGLQQSAVGLQQSPVQSLKQSAVGLQQSPVQSLKQSAVGLQQSPVGLQQSPVQGLKQSAVGLQQSPVGLQQSPVQGLKQSAVGLQQFHQFLQSQQSHQSLQSQQSLQSRHFSGRPVCEHALAMYTYPNVVGQYKCACAKDHSLEGCKRAIAAMQPDFNGEMMILVDVLCTSVENGQHTINSDHCGSQFCKKRHVRLVPDMWERVQQFFATAGVHSASQSSASASQPVAVNQDLAATLDFLQANIGKINANNRHLLAQIVEDVKKSL